MSEQMNWEIGVLSETDSHVAISKHTILTYPKLSRKRTTTIAMLFTLCMNTSDLFYRGCWLIWLI